MRDSGDRNRKAPRLRSQFTPSYFALISKKLADCGLEGIVNRADFHLSTQTLRLYLIDMCRIAQRCIGYAIGAFQEGNPDMIACARDSAYEIQDLQSDTTEIAYDLLLMEKMTSGRDVRFALSSIRISESFQGIHDAAVEIASNTMRFWGNGGAFELTDFPWMGEGVKRLAECCTASLLEEDIEPAEIVLSTDGLERELLNMFYDWYGTLEQSELSQAKSAFAIARSLSKVVHHAREIAEALVFWLVDENFGSFAQASDEQLINELTPASIKALEAAISGRC